MDSRLTSRTAYVRLSCERHLFRLGSPMILRNCLVLFFVVSSVSAQTSPGTKDEVVRYHATIDNVKYVYGVAPPVANVKPGNILEANSLDCFGNALQKPGDSFSLVKGANPLTGPFYIDGAEPAARLVVDFCDWRRAAKKAVAPFG